MEGGNILAFQLFLLFIHIPGFTFNFASNAIRRGGWFCSSYLSIRFIDIGSSLNYCSGCVINMPFFAMIS